MKASTRLSRKGIRSVTRCELRKRERAPAERGGALCELAPLTRHHSALRSSLPWAGCLRGSARRSEPASRANRRLKNSRIHARRLLHLESERYSDCNQVAKVTSKEQGLPELVYVSLFGGIGGNEYADSSRRHSPICGPLLSKRISQNAGSENRRSTSSARRDGTAAVFVNKESEGRLHERMAPCAELLRSGVSWQGQEASRTR
eukprot:2828790-Pleurochrysis_carterae.AAC.1